jgi:ATP adenylyltransferase
MDRLWSPWRYRYVSRAMPSDDCIFCAKSAEGRDEENLILTRGKTCFVLLNLFPYTTGHLMVAPYNHGASLLEYPAETLHEMMDLAAEAERHLRAVYRPHGLNAGLNLGECAGAGVAGHIHLHVLPRWSGDANFMTTIAETRVMPEELGETWRKLSAAFRGGNSR